MPLPVSEHGTGTLVQLINHSVKHKLMQVQSPISPHIIKLGKHHLNYSLILQWL